MSGKEMPQIILSMLKSRYTFLGWNDADFSDIISEINREFSLEKNLLICEESLAKKILPGKDFDKNIKLVKSYLKIIASSHNYSLLEKIKLAALLFSGAEDLENSLLYKDVLTSNMYIRTIINSIEEKDIQKLFDCDEVVTLLEDFEKFSQEAVEKNRKTDTFVSGDDEFSEIVNTYRDAYPDLLTPERERELLIRASENDKYAKNELVGHNWRLILSIAKGYIGRGIPLTDLFQEGNLGLITAIERFDVSRSLRLSTYATWWIKQRITRYVEDNARAIRYPVHVGQKVYAVRKVYNALTKQYGTNPSMQDVADVLDMDVARVIELFNLPDVTASLNQVIGDDEDTEFQDFLADMESLSPEEYAERSTLKEEIAGYLSLLPKRQEQILRLRFGIDDGKPRTLEIVGSEFGVTRERVRQLEAKALRRLKRIIEGKKAAIKVAAYSRPNASRQRPKLINNPYDYYAGNSHEDIDRIASTLPEELQEIYKKRFSEDCDENTKVIYMGRVDPPMRARLAGLKRHSNDKERYIREVVKYNDKITTAPLDKIGITDAYEYFEDFPAEDVSLVAESLPEDLKKMYDERFSGGEVTRNQHVLFTKKVVPIMRGRLKALALHQDDKVNYLKQLIEKKERYGKCHRAKTVYEFFDKYTHEELDTVIDALDDDNKELLALRFSEDGCSDEIRERFSYSLSNNILSRLKWIRKKALKATETVQEEQSNQDVQTEQIKQKEIVNNDEKNVIGGEKKMGKRGHQPAKTIYEYFKGYTKEQVDQVLGELNEADQAMVSERFGENAEVTKEVMSNFSRKVGIKIHRKLKKMNNATIISGEVTSESGAVVETEIANQSGAELVEEATGSRVVEPKEDNEVGEELPSLEKLPKPIKKVEEVILQGTTESYESEISPVFKTPLFMEKTRDLPYESLVAVALRLGFVGGKEYSIEAISSFLGMEVEVVSQIVTTTLDSYKKDIVNMFYNVPSRSENGVSYIKKPSNNNKN